jgi:hypothetical protein
MVCSYQRAAGLACDYHPIMVEPNREPNVPSFMVDGTAAGAR